MKKHKFKQLRIIEWIKTNPQPLNSKTNYLTNSREIALTAVKGNKPTFHSKYDNGIYHYPMASGKKRFHPTQKGLLLFEELLLGFVGVAAFAGFSGFAGFGILIGILFSLWHAIAHELHPVQEFKSIVIPH